MKILISPWVVFMLVVCAFPIGFGITMMVLPSAGGLWLGIPMTAGGLVILWNYIAPNVWLVHGGVVRCLRWSVRIDEVELVKVLAGSPAASPNPGWQVALQTAGGDLNGLACWSSWGATRQAHRVGRFLGDIPVKDPFWWEPPEGSVSAPPRHAR